MMNFLKSVREQITPVLKESAFLERGVLTPEEFVRAGDQLVGCCSSWHWGSGDQAKMKDYLPADKQFLYTRGVPCYQRVSQMNEAASLMETFDGDEDGWEIPVSSGASSSAADGDAVEAGGAVEEDGSGISGKEAAGSVSAPAPVEPAITSIDDLEDDSLALDDPTITPTSNVVLSRRYDVSITYDKYYQTHT